MKVTRNAAYVFRVSAIPEFSGFNLFFHTEKAMCAVLLCDSFVFASYYMDIS